jgi:chorismate synthase
MAGNSFGQLFRITSFGESHGGAVGVVLDGCPPGLAISEQDIQAQLDRRRTGQSDITTPRKEQDIIHILSGVFEGKTTGTPVLMLAHNKDVRSQDYDILKDLFRPSHADFTYTKKYGARDWRGSGRASARETLARVAAGAVAMKFLKERLGIEIISYVEQVGDIVAEVDHATFSLEEVEASIVRCPEPNTASKMIALIREVQADGDSIGGVIRGTIRGVPAGLGEPVFDKLHADLGKAMLSINAAKGDRSGVQGSSPARQPTQRPF